MKALDHITLEGGLPRGVLSFLYSSLTPVQVTSDTSRYFSDAPEYGTQLLLTEDYLYVYSGESDLHSLRLPLHRIKRLDAREKLKQGPTLVVTCQSQMCYNKLAQDDASDSFMITFTLPKRKKKSSRTAEEDFEAFRRQIERAHAKLSHNCMRHVNAPPCFASIAKAYAEKLEASAPPPEFVFDTQTLRSLDACQRILRLAGFWAQHTSFNREQQRFLRAKEYERTLLSTTGISTSSPADTAAPTQTKLARIGSQLEAVPSELTSIATKFADCGSTRFDRYDQGVMFGYIQPFDLPIDLTDLLWSFLSVKSSPTTCPVEDKAALMGEIMAAIGSYVAASPFYVQQRSSRYILLSIDEVFALINRSRPGNPVHIKDLHDIIDYIERIYRSSASNYSSLPAYLPWELDGRIYFVNKPVRCYKTLDIFILMTLYNEFKRRRVVQQKGTLAGQIHPCIRSDDLARTVYISVVTAEYVLNHLERRLVLSSEVVGGIKYYYLDRITCTYRAMMRDLEKKGLIQSEASTATGL